MGNFIFDKEGINQIKDKIVVIKDELDLSLKDNNVNLDSIRNNWKGKRATVTLSNIDNIKTNNDKLLEKINENINYIKSVVQIYEEASNAALAEKQKEVDSTPKTPSPTASPSPVAEPVATPSPSPTSSPSPVPEPVATPSPSPTSSPSPVPEPVATPSTSPTSTPSSVAEPVATPSPTTSPEDDSLLHGEQVDYTKYDRGKALLVGSPEYNKLPETTKERLNLEYKQAIEEGIRTGGTKGGLSAAANFYFKNNLGIPFSASGKHDIYMEGLDTNLEKGSNAPNSASWLQMLLYDVTGEKKANLRLNNNTNLNGNFLQGEQMKKEIPNVSSGDIFFNKPKNPNDSSAVGHAYLVVGKEDGKILVAELGYKGLTISPKTEEELSRLDGLTILNENI